MSDSKFILAKLKNVKIELSNPDLRTQIGNQRYLVNDITGLTSKALKKLAYMHPIIVRAEGESYVPMANLHMLSLFKTGLDGDEEIPLIVVESIESDDWAIMDSVIAPLLRALDPISAHEQLDINCQYLPPEKIKFYWHGAHTAAGLARLLGINRLQLYRNRKSSPAILTSDED